MNKKPKQKPGNKPLCTYCGISPGVTKDHVIPQCLFIEPIPQGQSMITVKACQKCHDEKSKNDIYLRDMLAIDIDVSEHPVVQAIQQKLFRAARTNRSDVARVVRAEGRIAPLYTPNGIFLGNFPTVTLDNARVQAAFSMIVKGLYYKNTKQRLPRDCVFEVRRIHPLHIQEFLENLKKTKINGPYKLGELGNEVFSYVYMFGLEDPTVSFWLLCFYRNLYVMVFTNPDSIPDMQANTAHGSL